MIINKKEIPLNRIYKTISIFFLINIYLFLFFCPCRASTSILSAFDIAENLQKNQEKILSFSSNIDQKLTHAESHTVEERKGKIYFKRPNYVVIDTFLNNEKKDDKTKIIMGPNTIWVYISDDEIAYKYPVSQAHDIAPSLLVITGQKNLLENFSIEQIWVEGEAYKLLLFPNDPTTQMVKVFLWINQKNGLLQRIQLIDFYENINDITFHNIHLNEAIKESLFSFVPPPGVIVEDHTQEGE